MYNNQIKLSFDIISLLFNSKNKMLFKYIQICKETLNVLYCIDIIISIYFIFKQ